MLIGLDNTAIAWLQDMTSSSCRANPRITDTDNLTISML